MTHAAIAANQANGQLGGRPPAAINDEQAAAIYEAVRSGVPPDAAAGVVGVRKRTLGYWLECGRRDGAEEPYATFAAEVDRALADWETHDIGIIGKAAENQWQAAAWRLERRLVQYRRHTRVEGNVTVTARPFIDVAKLSLDEQRQLRDLLLKAQPNEDDLPPEARPALELMPGEQEAVA